MGLMVCDGMVASSVYAAILHILGSESKFRERLVFEQCDGF